MSTENTDVTGYAALLILLISPLLAFLIKWSWNSTMPYLFVLPMITWGKAWCLWFLARCLLHKFN